MTQKFSPIQTIGLLLVPDFALMSYASAVEPLRAANLFAGYPLYRWLHITPDMDHMHHVPASCGATVPCNHSVADDPVLDLLLVCAGGNPASFDDPASLAFIRRYAQRGAAIGGVSGGPFILAKAGIMAGHHMTIHWEHALALAESYPDLLLSRSLYIIDRKRLTCAGGVAPLDMMHALIAEQHGSTFATRVSDWFLHTEIRPAGGPQRASMIERYGVHKRELIAALELMENNLADPLPRVVVANRAGLSTRHLDRLFRQHMKTSFAQHYRTVRLERARELLGHSSLALSEIALACGFANASHFARGFKAAFGQSPGVFRKL